MHQIELLFARKTTAHVTRLEQELVYQGLLEGLPTREMNERLLAQIRQRPHCYLVPPTQREIDYPRKYPFGTPAALPRVMCMASASCQGWSGVTHNAVANIVWFQEEWALPIDDRIMKHLSKVKWRDIAHEYEI